MVQWHATRGATSQDRQVEATENWFANPLNDKGGWGGSADFVVGPDHRIGGAIAIVQFGDWVNTFSSWSAGAGGAGTLYAAEYGVAIEVAQSANLESFTPETIDACVWLVHHINIVLRDLGRSEIPPFHLPRWDQLAGQGVPRGHIGHDELANGQRLGKTDPGPLFPWATLMQRLQQPLIDDFQRGRREVFDAWVREEEAHLEYVRSLREAWGIR